MVLPLIFGALAPSVLAGTGMSALMASALGAGIGGAIQTGDLEQGLLTGIGAFAGGSLLGPVLGGKAGAAATPGHMLGGQAPGALAQPLAGQVATGSGANAMTALAAGNPGLSGASAAALLPPTAPGGVRGLIGDAMRFAGSPTGQGAAIGAVGLPMLAGMFRTPGGEPAPEEGEPESMSVYGAREPRPVPRPYVVPNFNDGSYVPGQSGEFNYGISTPYSAQQIMDYTDRGVLPYANGGMLRRMANPNLPIYGPVRLSGGGIVALAEGGEVPQQASNEREVISAAVSAVKGQHPQPEIALGAFLAMFGEERLRELVDAVQDGAMDDTAERFAEGEKGAVRGPGDGSGTDDMVPAKMEDGSGDVLLSDGEFVLRKDATDALEKKFGGGFLDSVNKAGPKAADVAARKMAAA